MFLHNEFCNNREFQFNTILQTEGESYDMTHMI